MSRPDLASCGHVANQDGECGCSWWPERAPTAGTDWPAPIAMTGEYLCCDHCDHYEEDYEPAQWRHDGPCPYGCDDAEE